MHTRDTCELCDLAQRRPELVVAQNEDWVLVHVHKYFTPGSLFLVAHDHVLAPEVGVARWTSAAPLLAKGTKIVADEGGAERVYLCAFGETLEHFHILLLRRTPEMPAQYDGARAAGLVDAIARSTTPFDDQAAASWAARYRASFV